MSLKSRIEITLCDPNDSRSEVSLVYELSDKRIARKFYALLDETVRAGIGLIDPDRFYNFPNDHRGREWVVQELNRCIDIINGHRSEAIPHRAELRMSQEFLNRLHRYFEDYRGAVLRPGAFYLSSPPATQKALNDYNLLIHRYEDLTRNEHKEKKFPHAVCCWDETKRSRLPLAPEDFREFERGHSYGDLIINYCELGKPILDAFYDRDHIIGDDNIRPLRYYSADLFLSFGETWPPKWRKLFPGTLPKGFRRWWKSNHIRVEGASPKPSDPSLALGHIVVGRLQRDQGSIRGLSTDEITALVGRHQFFKVVRPLSARS